jgi:hypothetical protein
MSSQILKLGTFAIPKFGSDLLGFKEFFPTEIADNILWLNNDPSTITMSGANRVSEWRDSSGNLNHLTQNTGANQPLYVANGINGQNGIQWDNATDQWLLRDFSTTYNQPMDFFVVWNLDANSTQTSPFVYDRGDTGGINRLLMYWNGNNVRVGSPTLTVAYAKNRPFNLINSQVSYNTTNTKVYENGILKNTISTGTSTFSSLRLGNFNVPAASNRLSGFICEFIIYSRLLSDIERLKVTNYLNNKYGI